MDFRRLLILIIKYVERYFFNVYDVYVMMFRYNISFNSYYLEMGATEGFMRAEIKKLEEEIKKLKTDLGTVIDERDNAFKKIKQLEQRLDNKEKVNKSLREENRKLKLHIEAKDKAYTALLKDYEELKENRKKILNEIEAEIERFKDFRKSLEK